MLWRDYFVDGLSDADRKEFSTFILEDIAVLNQKDARYTLSKHAFSEVKQDWPFYSEQEKEIIRKWVVTGASRSKRKWVVTGASNAGQGYRLVVPGQTIAPILFSPIFGIWG